MSVRCSDEYDLYEILWLHVSSKLSDFILIIIRVSCPKRENASAASPVRCPHLAASNDDLQLPYTVHLGPHIESTLPPPYMHLSNPQLALPATSKCHGIFPPTPLPCPNVISPLYHPSNTFTSAALRVSPLTLTTRTPST